MKESGDDKFCEEVYNEESLDDCIRVSVNTESLGGTSELLAFLPLILYLPI